MTDINDALIDQGAQALSNHILGPKWVCICGLECWQPDAGNGNQCATASYGVHRQHMARAVLEAVAPAIRAQALRDTADWLDDFRPFPGEETEALRERADQIEEGK